MGAPKGSQNAKGNKGGNGQPEKYRPEFNKRATRYALLGLTDEQIAGCFEVSHVTLKKWKDTKPEFKEALEKGKVEADAKVAYSLYKRATGYSHTETKVFCSEGMIVTKDVTKKYAPCPVSAKMWLHNRQPEKWRERKDEPEQNPDSDRITEIRKTVVYKPKDDA